MLKTILCLMGFHDFRVRKNGESSERVCMNLRCNYREKLYATDDEKHSRLQNSKKIPMKRGFRKIEEERR